jgi:hypothetical protein
MYSNENTAQVPALLVTLRDLPGDGLPIEQHKDAPLQTLELAVMRMVDLLHYKYKKMVRIDALPHTTSPY